MMNPGVLITFGVGGFIIFAIVLLIGFRMLRDEQREKSTPKADNVKSLPPPPLLLPPPSPPMTNQDENAHEVLRVLRDNLTGRLVVEIAGRRYERIQDIRDANIGRGFVTTLRDLQKFLSGTQSPASSLPPIPLPAPQRPPEPPPTTSGQPLAASLQPPTPSHPTLSELPPIQKPSMNPFKQAKVLRDLEKQQGPPPKSIPEQIDEILQEKLARTPHRGRGCRVYLGPKGSVIFDLDGKSYEGVDQVPDAEVQTIIRAAVAEWEKKQ